MRYFLWRLLFLLSLLLLAACGGSSNTASSPPASSLPAGFVSFTSADHTYQIAYPSGWQEQRGTPNAFLGPAGQYFEVANAGKPDGSIDQIVNVLCQSIQPDVAASPVQTSVVRLANQQWTRGDCDAGTQASVNLIVEAVIYKGAVYHMAYVSPLAAFQSDTTTFYAPMEQSFQFLQ